MKTIISNPSYFEQIKAKIKEQGFEKLHILADFDKTLTYASVNGQRIPAVIAALRDGNHLTADYAKKAHALHDKYHPIEYDPNVPLPEKKKAIMEWFEAHFKLLIESGLNKKDLEDIVQNSNLKFRDGVPEFLDFLHEHRIPLVILSAGGCGDSVRMFFQKIGKDYDNIFYVTNKFNWDENGNAVSVQKPIIHSLNKDETVLKEVPEVYKIIENRKNVILLGDSLGDLGMIEGFEYENLLKVGFLNFDVDEKRDEYVKNFDVVLEGDGGMEKIVKIINEINYN